AKLPQIFGYALIAATVGLLLRMIQERLGLIGRLVVGFIGLAWTVATFLVVPVLASKDVGPVDAVKESVELLKRSWGENLIGNGGIGIVFGLLMVLAVLVGAVLIGDAVGRRDRGGCSDRRDRVRPARPGPGVVAGHLCGRAVSLRGSRRGQCRLGSGVAAAGVCAEEEIAGARTSH